MTNMELFHINETFLILSRSVKRGQHRQQKRQDVEVKSTNYDTDRLKISTT